MATIYMISTILGTLLAFGGYGVGSSDKWRNKEAPLWYKIAMISCCVVSLVSGAIIYI